MKFFFSFLLKLGHETDDPNTLHVMVKRAHSLKWQCHLIFGNFFHKSNTHGPLINRLNWFPIRFPRDFREISDYAHTNTNISWAESDIFFLLSNISISRKSRVHMMIFGNIFQQFAKIQNWLIPRGVGPRTD